MGDVAGDHGLAHTTTLLVAAGHRHRARLEAVMGGKRQQRGVEADGIPLAFEHGAFEIVVEQHPRQTAPSPKGRLVAAQKTGP